MHRQQTAHTTKKEYGIVCLNAWEAAVRVQSTAGEGPEQVRNAFALHAHFRRQNEVADCQRDGPQQHAAQEQRGRQRASELPHVSNNQLPLHQPGVNKARALSAPDYLLLRVRVRPRGEKVCVGGHDDAAIFVAY